MIVTDIMRIVLPIHCDGETIEVHSFAFLSIPSGFFPFADHSIIHDTVSFQEIGRKKGTRVALRAPGQSIAPGYVVNSRIMNLPLNPYEYDSPSQGECQLTLSHC